MLEEEEDKKKSHFMKKLNAVVNDGISGVENQSQSKTFDSRKPHSSIVHGYSKAAVTFTNQLLTRVNINSKISTEEKVTPINGLYATMYALTEPKINLKNELPEYTETRNESFEVKETKRI